MTYFASTKESVVLHFMDTVATIIFALAAVAFAWDASAVEVFHVSFVQVDNVARFVTRSLRNLPGSCLQAGLFTFTPESSDGSASYIFNMVPKAELVRVL
jgi:hypothetical protein